MRQHIVMTRLFEFGGSNTYLKTLLKYFGGEKTILILQNNADMAYLGNIEMPETFCVSAQTGLHGYAHLSYPSLLSNLKELFFIFISVARIFFMSLKHGFADLTISVVEPEKYLYLLCVPFIKVNYVLHSTPSLRHSIFTTYICKFALNKRKCITTVSNANKELLLQRWKIPQKKEAFVHVVYNCVVEPSAIQTVKTNGKKYILTLGHVVAYKNPAIWLEVAQSIVSKYHDVDFIWVGSGPLLEEFRTAAAAVSGRIKFHGADSHPESYLASAMIYYQPSIHETHGIAVVEAMYHHLPCVVSATGGLTESITDQYNGLLVDPFNAKEHVKALISIIDQPGVCKKFGENGYKRYKNLFSFKIFKANMDAIYLN
ncbi:glycosyltransferase family 4 protein [Mucilaginibacter flavidus]|uniref:glycosyltransferase family 4 protein n=1 Tax=Mucilaginibacter flavidus TaxID=2949309 RepID=UPI002093E741|nr:glycosyltransferase family 4 protein [Mucilaginibacter flavidus]MCO5947665.1 glycosyltransferase family 4 protein [Mucilaginibacter flavidus]